MRTSPLNIAGIVFLLCIATNCSALAQEWCTYQGSGAGKTNQISSVPTSGTYRALAVFVRFADDTTSISRDWPVSLTTPPDFAYDVLSSDTTTFPTESVTQYFFDQSDPNDPFILYGDIYPEVVVTDSSEFSY